MNKSDLIKVLNENNLFFSINDTNDSVNLIINFISESLSDKNRIELRNFGTFSVRQRKKRISRNPKTGTSIAVQEKSYPYFRASKSLKETLNN